MDQKTKMICQKRITEIQKTLDSIYLDTGKQFLELADQSQRKVTKLIDELVLLKRQLSELQNDIQCTHCMTLNDRDNHFCKNCGNDLRKQSWEEKIYE